MRLPLPIIVRHLTTLVLLAYVWTCTAATNQLLMGMRSPDFHPPEIEGGLLAAINSLNPLPDGSVIIGGNFSLANGSNWPALVKLNPSGRLDATFRPPFVWDAEHSLFKAVLQPGTNTLSSPMLLVSGYFVATNSARLPQLFRLNLDGTLDPSFRLEKVAGYMSDFTVANDGSIFATGEFYLSAGSEHSLARFHRDGSLDTNFVSAHVGFIGHKILLQNDGAFLVGGSTFRSNGWQYTAARVNPDGTHDLTFHPPAGFISISPGWYSDSLSRVYFFGSDGTNSTIVRLKRNGDIDETFSRTFEFPNSVSDLLEWNHQLYAAGLFYDSTNYMRPVVRLLSDGELDPDFTAPLEAYSFLLAAEGSKIFGAGWAVSNSPLVTAFDATGIVQYRSDVQLDVRGEIYTLARQSTGNLLVAMTTSYPQSDSMVRLKPDGRKDSAFHFTNWAQFLSVVPNDAFLATTWFEYEDSFWTAKLERYHPEGVLDPTFLSPQLSGFDQSAVDAVSGRIVLATNALDGSSLPVIRRFLADGRPDPSFAVNATSYWVKALLPLRDGKTLASGSFSTSNRVERLIRLSENGSVDESFIGGPVDIAWMVEGIDEQIVAYASGHFNGSYRLLRLRTTGSVDSSFNPAFGTNSTLVCAAVQPDGKTIVWGRLVDTNNTRLPPVVRLNNNGSFDPTFQCDESVAGYAKVLVVEPSGDIVVGGIFAVPPDSSEVSLVRLIKYSEPVLGAIRVEAGEVRFELQTVRGREYLIESSADFSEWETLHAFRATNTSTTVASPVVLGAQFYRAVLVQ